MRVRAEIPTLANNARIGHPGFVLASKDGPPASEGEMKATASLRSVTFGGQRDLVMDAENSWHSLRYGQSKWLDVRDSVQITTKRNPLRELIEGSGNDKGAD